ncbi:MAG: DUF1569 domain-containing protein [Acidovorax sp.]|nr:DUF1569 domain-containing protein [Acidovorax sp.]
MTLRRRTVLLAPLALAGTAAHADTPRVLRLSDAPPWLDRLEAARGVRTSGAWPLAAVLAHLAQSIEMSLDGYPAPRSALFQQTLGAGAFAFFAWRGRMSHPLDEPIPGAPALPREGDDWRAAVQRLRAAIARFEAHGGALRPHFAYGALDKAQYRLAHAMHIANHQDEIVLA